jgi:hypothetical protein
MDNDKEFTALWGAKMTCHLKPIMMQKLEQIQKDNKNQKDKRVGLTLY